MRVLNQIIIGATRGDAITDEALLLRRWLQEMGFASEIFAQFIHPDLANEIRSVAGWRRGADEKYLVYHHSIGSPVVEQLVASGISLILIYHNVTPPEFFDTAHPALSREMKAGREQLAVLCANTALGLADSAFNQRDLIATQFRQTDVMPIAVDASQLDLSPNPELAAQYKGEGPFLLFVGRHVPNKKQEDVIKLLYFYRRLEPSARLFLVGDAWLPPYTEYLRDLVSDLGLEDGVVFAINATQQDLATYYRLADVYVSMSEHEGFGKPLIESMYMHLPVLAYSAAAVPGTLGDAGVQFHHKDYESLAEVIDLMVRDQLLRQRLIARQCAQVEKYLAPRVQQLWHQYVSATVQ